MEHNLTQKRKWLIIFLHQRARQAFDFEQSIKLVGRKKSRRLHAHRRGFAVDLRLAGGRFQGDGFHGAKPGIEGVCETGFSHPRLSPPDITYLRCF